MIRRATTEDASRIAEISIFTKRMNYRAIFQNDKVSFGEMQVYPLAEEYVKKPELLEGIFVRPGISLRCFTTEAAWHPIFAFRLRSMIRL